MALLGEMLVKDKVITKAQLEEAIQSQVIFGGRLGTNLIELGYIDEQTLTKYLAKKYNVPTVNWNQLNRIKPQVIKLFSKNLAKRCEALPLKADDKNIWVVMADPGNIQAIEEIQFATGKKVKPLVLPEIRVFHFLNEYYGIGRELRYINLAMMYQVRKETKKPEMPSFKSTAPPGMSEEDLKEREKILASIAKPTGDLLDEEEFKKMTERGWTSQEEEAASPAPEAAEQTQEPPPPPPAIPAPPSPARQKEAGLPKPPTPKAPPRPPYREVAQSLYSLLMKRGIEQYIPKATLQEFLKLFVRNQLKHNQISMNYLANWLIIEADVPVEWLEKILEEYKDFAARSLGVQVFLPGEAMPEPAAAAPAPPAPEPAAEPPPEKRVTQETTPTEEAEVIEEPELVEEEVEELPSEALTPLEASPPSAEPAAEQAQPPGEPQVFELSAEDMAEAEEMEAYVPPAAEEEEVPAEEYEQLSLEEARRKLMEEVSDRKDISRIVLGFARGFFKRSLLFTVRGETLFGWDGVGEGINSDLVESIMLPLTEDSVFKLVNTTKSFFLGPVPPNPVNNRFLKLLGGARPNNVFIMPVVVNEKVVYIIYGDNGEGEFVPVNAPELQILAYQIPQALETLIRRKKEEMKKLKEG